MPTGGFGYTTPYGRYGTQKNISSEQPISEMQTASRQSPAFSHQFDPTQLQSAITNYAQQLMGTGGAALTPQQMQAQKNLMTQRAMTGQAGMGEAMAQHFARMGMAGSGPEAEALMRAKLMGQMGLQQQLTGFETGMAQDTANRALNIGQFAGGLTGTLGGLDLQRQLAQRQQDIDALSNQYYLSQFADQKRLEDAYRNLWQNRFQTPQLPINTGGLYG